MLEKVKLKVMLNKSYVEKSSYVKKCFCSTKTY